jgi:hypothetical protein
LTGALSDVDEFRPPATGVVALTRRTPTRNPRRDQRYAGLLALSPQNVDLGSDVGRTEPYCCTA